MWPQVRDKLRFATRRPADEAAAFVSQWVRERGLAKARIALHLGTAYNAIAGLTDPFSLLPKNVPIFYWFHGVSLAAVALRGAGSMLGVSPELALRPVTLALPADRQATLLLATDGVLPRGSRSSRRDVQELLASLRGSGRAALAARPGNDDKTLVCLERKAA